MTATYPRPPTKPEAKTLVDKGKMTPSAGAASAGCRRVVRLQVPRRRPRDELPNARVAHLEHVAAVEPVRRRPAPVLPQPERLGRGREHPITARGVEVARLHRSRWLERQR